MYEELREEAMVGVIGKQFQEICLEKLLGKGNNQDIERVVVYIKRALAKRRRILKLREIRNGNGKKKRDHTEQEKG